MLKMLVAGGDRRMLLLAELLQKDCFPVDTLGLKKNDEAAARPEQADAVLFPYPFAVRGGLVPTLTGLPMRPQDVPIRPAAAVLAGAGLEKVLARPVIRYDQSPGFLQRNADLSAEAAVSAMMEKSDLALMDSRALVTGYGHFGRALARRLRSLGTLVTVAARRETQLLLAETDGMDVVPLEAMGEAMPDQDWVLNTIPARVFTERVLDRIPRSAWLLELASAPYGFDKGEAVKLGLQVDLLPGLPARYAPRSAAMALKQACLDLVKEEAL